MKCHIVKTKDFLVEPKLLALLEPLEKNERSLIKLDAIFRALKVENEEDIKLMAKFFVDHIQQQSKNYVSSGAGPEQEDEQEGRREEREEVTEVSSSFNRKEIHILKYIFCHRVVHIRSSMPMAIASN